MLALLAPEEILGQWVIQERQVLPDKGESLDLAGQWEVQDLRVFRVQEVHRVHKDPRVVLETLELPDLQEVQEPLVLRDSKGQVDQPARLDL